MGVGQVIVGLFPEKLMFTLNPNRSQDLARRLAGHMLGRENCMALGRPGSFEKLHCGQKDVEEGRR